MRGPGILLLVLGVTLIVGAIFSGPLMGRFLSVLMLAGGVLAIREADL